MTQSSKINRIGIRIFLAVILLSAFIIMDIRETEIFSVNADYIYSCITKNYIPNSFAFIKEITYTFTHG